MFEIAIFCVIVFAVVYWAVLFTMGRRDDVLHGEFVKATGTKRIHAGIFPNIGTVSTVPPELDIVGMRLRASFKEQNQLVF